MAGYTLLLDSNWDITLDSAGNIATATEAYGIAQNVANAVRLFTDEAWYDPERGIPHFVIDLGVPPDFSVVRSRVRQAALGVDGVRDAAVDIANLSDRTLQGDIKINTTGGENVDVTL